MMMIKNTTKSYIIKSLLDLDLYLETTLKSFRLLKNNMIGWVDKLLSTQEKALLLFNCMYLNLLNQLVINTKDNDLNE